MSYESADHCQAALKMRECFLWVSLWKRIRQKVAIANSKNETEFLRVSRLKKGRPGILSRLA